MFLDIWREWLLAAFPWKTVVIVLLMMTGAYYLGDYIYQGVKESKQVVTEVIDTTSKQVKQLTLAVSQGLEPSVKEAIVHGVDIENTRVLRI